MIRLSLEATPEALEKGVPELLERLSLAVKPHSPRAAAALTRAAQETEEAPMEPEDQAIRDSLAETRRLYSLQCTRMLDEIGKLLDARAVDMVRETEAGRPS